MRRALPWVPIAAVGLVAYIVWAAGEVARAWADADAWGDQSVFDASRGWE